jgi:hypothetical protein
VKAASVFSPAPAHQPRWAKSFTESVQTLGGLRASR